MSRWPCREHALRRRGKGIPRRSAFCLEDNFKSAVPGMLAVCWRSAGSQLVLSIAISVCVPESQRDSKGARAVPTCCRVHRRSFIGIRFLLAGNLNVGINTLCRQAFTPFDSIDLSFTMPSHTIHSALAQMYFAKEHARAPWDYPVWQELTGVRHGLFPADDDKLPAGWTRQTATDIASYFDQFRAIELEEEKIKFSSMKDKSQMVPGRKAWKEWVTKLWKKAKMHDKIIKVFAEQEMHPYQLMQADSSAAWPDALVFIPLMIESVGLAIFGEEAFSLRPVIVHVDLRNPVRAVMTRSWITLNTSLGRMKKKIAVLEDEANKAFEGKTAIPLPLVRH